MNNWVIYNKKCDEKKISEDFNISPLLVRILNNREISSHDDIKMMLSSDINDLHDEKNLPNIDKAVDIIIDKIKNKKHIRIIGDYDIDGVCSTYILYDAIKKMGGEVSYHIPHRVNDGYGININIID
ncbi:MAG: single-stranded-DNA-specific exonuclease RecJ, partial [Lachnospiraceae bacterium]|nr:single-stranded-DNA-specific exonuclease RecJ [Lachnospiraceae bacterium]